MNESQENHKLTALHRRCHLCGCERYTLGMFDGLCVNAWTKYSTQICGHGLDDHDLSMTAPSFDQKEPDNS